VLYCNIYEIWYSGTYFILQRQARNTARLFNQGMLVSLLNIILEMSNSFYYFFSTTPQVLAAILALFGVFVIFKIQTLEIKIQYKSAYFELCLTLVALKTQSYD